MCTDSLFIIDLYLLYQIKLSEDIMDNLWTTYVFELPLPSNFRQVYV